jgi:hypothetical protein
LLKLSKNAIIKIMVEEETAQGEDFALQPSPSKPERGTPEWYRERCDENAKLAAKREARTEAARGKREGIKRVGQKALGLEPAPHNPPRHLTEEETRQKIAENKSAVRVNAKGKKE